ncbi:MAG TPA: hypothetical protein VHB47_26460 [Thermoanaerobaculia bacterium]|nr:hypothetical protein [Thermoanaerobaculia bacterium]
MPLQFDQALDDRAHRDCPVRRPVELRSSHPAQPRLEIGRA